MSGFHYQDADGRRVDAATVKRIEALRVPPAWTEVFIHPSSRAHLQAVGRDKAGRWQYRYHEGFRARQDALKFERLVAFGHALPSLRRTITRHLRLPGMQRERVMAGILRILSTSFLRPGSQVYAAENGSYGIATLRPQHVSVRGDVVRFSFPGKSGKRQERALRDRSVARLVRELLAAPGREVFKFRDAEGRLIDVRRRDINAYIREVMGQRFSAKDFRTWAGTLLAACALARSVAERPEAVGAGEQKRQVRAAVKEASIILGNTPAVCRASYIGPAVLEARAEGQVIRCYFRDLEELVAQRAPVCIPPNARCSSCSKRGRSGSGR
ncbi:MAG TPA: DNA topoisomerase IB [Myxococcaceae bacterium]|nr:DNA topoisomerase IB [Myxococcaceae bacterium]